MTITTTTARNNYTGAGSTGPYAYTFRIFAATDLLVVTRNTSSGIETPLAYVTDYSVTGVGEGAGGTITLTSALAVGYTMAITRVVPIVQDTDLRNQGTFYPQTYEDALDYLTAIDQQQEDAIERSLKVGDAINPANFDTVISTVPAGAYLRVNTSGNGFEAAVGTVNTSSFTQSGAGAVTRTVTAKLGEWYSVKDFGAACDGVTDDTAAITAALNAIPSGSTLRFFGTSIVSSQLAIPTDHITLEGPATLKAKDGTNFLVMLDGTGRTNCWCVGLTFDANQAGRVSGQNVRFCGAGFTASTRCGFINCTVKNTLGYGGLSATGIVCAGQSEQCEIQNCVAVDCGTEALPSDGFFIAGTANVISGSRATRCTDTGFVIESSDYSIVSGCAAYDCIAPAAITNGSASDRYGNAIVGFVARSSKSPGTGAILIGITGGVAAKLYDTVLDGFTMHYTLTGAVLYGPAVHVSTNGTGYATGVTIANGVISGATTQGILVESSKNVTITNVTVKDTVGSCIDFRGTSTNGRVSGCYITGGTYGVALNDAVDVIVTNCLLTSNSAYCLAAGDTSTLTDLCNTLVPASGRVSKAAGATVRTLGLEGSNLRVTGLSAAPVGALNGKIAIYNYNGTLLGYVPTYAT